MHSLRLILSDRRFFAPAWVFASINILTGTWVLYLPYVKSKFALNDSEIGLALFSLAFGLLLSIPFVPFINRKIGIGLSTKWGIVLYGLAFNLPLLASSYTLLCACLLLVGVFSGFTDISMNALVATIEKNSKRHIMSASHGFFSLGGFIGAGIGSLLMPLFLEPVWHMLLISILLILTNLFLAKNYVDVQEEPVEKVTEERGFKHIRPLLGLAFVAFIIMCNEGSVEHWSNLFFFDIVKVAENKAGLGFIAFSLFMTLGRFLGDGISKRVGSIKIILGGCSIAFFGYLFILSAHLFLSVAGFAIIGLGLSVVIPELFRLAGNTQGVAASVGISIVSGIGFVGFLLGPVILGLISNCTHLIWSFAFLAGTILLVLGLTFLHLRGRYKG